MGVLYYDYLTVYDGRFFVFEHAWNVEDALVRFGNQEGIGAIELGFLAFDCIPSKRRKNAVAVAIS